MSRAGTGANLRWSNTTDGAHYSHPASGGVGGVYLGETYTLVVDHGSSVMCSMTTSDGGGSVSGGLGGVVADHVRIIAADVQIELADFQHN